MAVLEIAFTGLFLFVPDAKNPKRLHVLLPVTGGGTGVHQHTATIGDLNTSASTPLQHENFVVPDQVQGTVLLPPPEAVDLEELTDSERFPRGRLLGHNPGSALARVVLPLATEMRAGEAARWDIQGLGRRVLTHQITWRLEGLPGSSVTVDRKPFNGPASVQTFQANAQGVVQICIQHLPTHTHTAQIGHEATHFAAYYAMHSGFGTGPNPKLAQPPTTPQPSPCDRFLPDLDPFNADTFTCMVAQVRAG